MTERSALAGAVLAPLVSIAAALAVGALVIVAAGFDAVTAAKALVTGAFGDQVGLRDVLDNAAVLTLTALAVSLPVRAGLFNIGGEGQLLVGALGGSIVAVQLTSGAPMLVTLPLSLLGAAIAGGVWGLIPGYLRGLGANEIITTLMFNFIALFGILALVGGPLQDPQGLYTQTEVVPSEAQLPLFPGTIIDVGIIIAILAAAIVLVLERRTVFGLRLKILGQSERAARFSGISPRRQIMMVMFIGGALAGLGGATQLLGVQLQVTQGFSPGFGFLGIAIAFLGARSPVGILLASLFFGALIAGGVNMQQVAGVPAPVISMIQGLAFAFILFALARRRLVAG